jgi:DNA-binding MarR family transcriptional regulator
MDRIPAAPAPHPEARRPDGWTSSDLSEALYRVMLALPELRLSLAERLALNPSEVDAMEHLMGHPMGPVELSRRLRMTSASATVLVDRLEEAGHVVREADPTDGRRRMVRPTGQGASAVFEQIGPLVADLVEAEQGLTAKERAAAIRYLGRVLDVLYEHTDRGPSA